MKCRITLLAIVFSVFPMSYAQETASTQPINQLIAEPAITSKAASRSIGRHIEGIEQKFKEKNLNTEIVRNGEVLKVTIPADQLFAPNETKLKAGAEHVLSYFKQAVSHPDSYRVVVAVFTDDTGDASYSTELTAGRAESVVKGLARTTDMPSGKINIAAYPFGNSNYTVPNNSIINRAKNRRIEIYLIPLHSLIEASRAK